MQRSAEDVARRAALVPQVTFPDELPITARLDELAALLRDHQVVVVAGETGSGKSTQLPKLCLSLGRGTAGMIGHTQPRRLAARTVAERVAAELGTTVATPNSAGGSGGGIVGCTVRFHDHTGDDTLIRVMTDGILLAQTRRDRDLRAYDTLIVDEAHERSLNIDFLLGYLHRLLPRRPDLKVIITSATIDTEKFAAHFGGAPVLSVSGRTYPVEVRYRPFAAAAGDDRDQPQAILDAVRELEAEGPGDVLVFLSGEREIHDTADALRRGLAEQSAVSTEIVPLYARLGLAEQRRVFAAHRGRRIVLATNVAETSITVPGIRYVVDAGTARISRFSRRLKVQRLPIEAISRASADQRAGRCGRVGPGVCIRLYADDDFANRDAFTEPEVQRTSLASVVLQAASLGIDDIAAFPFVDPPDRRDIADGVALLEELGAMEGGHLTGVGRRMARLPIDPRYARMLIEAERLDCLRDVGIIVSALSIQDPRERPPERAALADQLHARHRVEGSDFLAYLRLWEHVRSLQSSLTKNEFRRRCQAELLNHLRVREWQDVERQLRASVHELGGRARPRPTPTRAATEALVGAAPATAAGPDTAPASTDGAPPEFDRHRAESVHRALLSGLLSHVGRLIDDDARRDRGRTPGGDNARGRPRRVPREYTGARNARFQLGAGSVLAGRPPRWVMAAELVETNRLWARTAAAVTPEWIEHASAHVHRRSVSDPRWDPARGTAVVTERVSLYGLPVVGGRSVDLARTDPAMARRLCIDGALVQGDWATRLPGVLATRRRVEQVRDLEVRARRRDVLVGDEERYASFDARVPADVTSGRALERWVRADPAARNAALTLEEHELIAPALAHLRVADFPDEWRIGAQAYPVTYRYEPLSEADGITVTLPLVAALVREPDDFEWLVPGRRAELVEALLRSLPKEVRRVFTNARAHADAFMARHAPADGRLRPLLAEYATAVLRDDPMSASVASVRVRADDFDVRRLPLDLQPRFELLDASGRVLAQGRDLAALTASARPAARAAVAAAAGFAETRGHVRWDVGQLPRVLDVALDGHRVRVYPSLVDEGDSVSTRLSLHPEVQLARMRAAVRRLVGLAVTVDAKPLERRLGNDARLALIALGDDTSPLPQLLREAVQVAIDAEVAGEAAQVWDATAFDTLVSAVRAGARRRADEVLAEVGATLVAARRVRAATDGLHAQAFDASVVDVERNLRRLIRPGFIAAGGLDRLVETRRCVEALARRAERLRNDPGRDQQRFAPIRALEREIDDVLADAPASRRGELVELRWSTEALRAQVLGGAAAGTRPVSEARIRRELDAIAPRIGS